MDGGTVHLKMILFFFLVVHGATSSSVTEKSCGAHSSSSSEVNLWINSKRDQDGEWLTTFKALKSDGSIDNFVVDVKQTVYDCAEGQGVQIMGVIHGNTITNNSYNTITFHPKCGTNAAISNDGKSVSKINDNVPLNGVVLTNRPLRRNEIFEVRLDRKLTLYQHSLGIGITSYMPQDIPLPEHMWQLKSGNWMYYHTKIHKDNQVLIVYYGKDINALTTGDRVGVMVNNFGVLHFFVNGVDQGPAASNIPAMVYGVVELYYNSAKVSIVDTPS